MLANIKIEGWPSSVWPAVAILAVVTVVALLRNNKYPRAPGPFLARFSNLWLAKTMSTGTFEKTNIELHRKHGELSTDELPFRMDG